MGGAEFHGHTQRVRLMFQVHPVERVGREGICTVIRVTDHRKCRSDDRADWLFTFIRPSHEFFRHDVCNHGIISVSDCCFNRRETQPHLIFQRMNIHHLNAMRDERTHAHCRRIPKTFVEQTCQSLDRIRLAIFANTAHLPNNRR